VEDRSANAIRFKTHADKSGLDLCFPMRRRMHGRHHHRGRLGLTNFKKNPMRVRASVGFPVGTWKNLRVVDKQLRGKL